MLYILLSQDDYSISEALEEIKRGIGDQSVLEANTTTLDGQQMTLDQLRAAGETLPFLAERRLVVVRRLLERFEPRGGSRRRRKTTRAVDHLGDEYKSFVTCIDQLPESTVLVLIGTGVTSRNPLLCELAARAEIRSFPLLRGIKLRQWIQKRVVGEGGNISHLAVDLLAQLVGGNLWIMANEIDKLIQFTSGRRIEEEDIRLVVSYAQQASVFNLVDAILEFRAGLAEQWLHQLLQRGASSAYLLVMLSRQVRLMVQVKELKRRGSSEANMRSRLGLTSDFAWRKVVEQAERYPLGRIREVYRRLLEADLSIKTGKYDGELVLNILIAELCQPSGTSVVHLARP